MVPGDIYQHIRNGMTFTILKDDGSKLAVRINNSSAIKLIDRHYFWRSVKKGTYKKISS